jgi:ankyrin repeat protein
VGTRHLRGTGPVACVAGVVSMSLTGLLVSAGCDGAGDGGAGTPKVTVTVGREPPRPTISLHRGAALGDMAQLQSHLHWGTDVNARGEGGARPLELAVANRHAAAAALLLDKGAELNIETRAGLTLLQTAVANEDDAMAELLLARGARPDGISAEELTPPLELAVSRESWALASRLLAGGGGRPGGYGPVLATAVKRGAPRELIVQLMARTPDPTVGTDGRAGTLLFDALEARDEVTTLELLGRGVDPMLRDGLDRTLLHIACDRFPEIALRLINTMPPSMRAVAVETVDMYGRTPLSYACGAGRTAVVEALLGAGADVSRPDKEGRTPLQHAMGPPPPEGGGVLKGLPKSLAPAGLVRAMVLGGADPNTVGQDRGTPLFYAVRERDAAWAGQLLAKRVAVNHADEEGRTPLHWAAVVGDDALVTLLLRHRATVDARDTGGRTPLMLANPLQDRYPFVVAALLTSRANPRAVDGEGWTALHHAASWRPSPFGTPDPGIAGRIGSGAALLRDGGLDVNATDKTGDTALHAAVRADNPAGVEAMIALGVDPRRKDGAGHTAHAIALGKVRAARDNIPSRAEPVLELLNRMGIKE